MSLITISSRYFLWGCFLTSFILFFVSLQVPISPYFIALEVALTVLSLFIFGSIRYRLDKNALTYGMGLVIFSTFFMLWWPQSHLKQNLQTEGLSALLVFFQHHLLTLHGLDALFHADTMLFILGLTFFVAVIAQTRLLETVSFKTLQKNKGRIVPTIIILTGLVSIASGILDGVSMIGLMIRILVMILFLSRTRNETIVYMIMVSTVVTTVCGMWLAYGEPPNLIMKANLHPHLDDAFFLRYCLPAAIGSYLIIAWNVRKKIKQQQISLADLDILDIHTADVRFLQAQKHGEVLIPTEFVDHHQEGLGQHYPKIEEKLHQGVPLGLALVEEGVPQNIRLDLLGKYLSEDIASALDEHYLHMKDQKGRSHPAYEQKIKLALESVHRRRTKAQIIGGLAFIPFVGFLILHALHHEVSIFWASFSGFLVALLGIFTLPKMRQLALQEAKQEFKEYLFLVPLFFSITLLQKTGFFENLSQLLHQGMVSWGSTSLAVLQFLGASFLSAILDNNVVADFAARALQGLEIGVLHLFAMAQIAGYAVGGCWTHIGCAQSVVAYAFIQREMDAHFTPWQWIKAMTPVIFECFLMMVLIIYGEAWLLHQFGD